MNISKTFVLKNGGSIFVHKKNIYIYKTIIDNIYILSKEKFQKSFFVGLYFCKLEIYT